MRGKQRRLYERRLLEFTRIPVTRRKYGWGLIYSHDDAWHDLKELRSKQFARSLRKWVAGRDVRLAAEAAKHLTAMAFDRDLLLLTRLVSDGPWAVRGSIAEGARQAVKLNYASRRFRDLMFDALAPLVTGEVPMPVSHAVEDAVSEVVEALPALNRREGYRWLMSDRVFHSHNPGIRRVAFQLYIDTVKMPVSFRGGGVDPAVLWPVYESLCRGRPRLAKHFKADKEPYDQARGNILHLAVKLDPCGAARECKKVLADKSVGKDSTLRSAAAACLKRCRGIPAPAEVLQEFYRRPGKFGRKAVDVIRAYEFYEHHLSDGLPLYFGNLGQHWRTAHTGLRAVGAVAAAAIVQRGAEIVEQFGPLRDERSVSATFAEVDEPALRKLEALDKRLDSEDANILAAIERFIATRPQDFSGRAARA